MQVEEYWDDEIVEVVEGKQLKVRPAKCFGFIIINWIRREESPLSDPETETGFPVLGLFLQFSNRKCNFHYRNSNVHALERFPGNLILSKWAR